MATPVRPKVTFSKWDHNSYQQLIPQADGNNIASDTVLVAAGPPLLSQTGGIIANTTGNETDLADDTAYIIGAVQGVQIGQQRQHMRIYELGSNYDYLITGRHMGTMGLSSIYMSTANLLRSLYAYYGTSGHKQIKALFNSPIAAAGALDDIYISPGSERIFINLFSDLFRHPIGILLMMGTTQYNTVGCFYLERCAVGGHNMSIDSQGMLVQENTQLTFSRIAPVDIQSVDLLAAVTNFADFFDITSAL